MTASIATLLLRQADTLGDRIAFTLLNESVEPVQQITYRQVAQRAQAIAADLCSRDLAGTRALLLYPAGPEFLCAFFGCILAGVIGVPAPPPESSRQKRSAVRLRSIIDDCDAQTVLTSGTTLSHADRLLQDIEPRPTYVNTEGILSETGLRSHDRLSRGSDTAYLQYTSGSTSTPKGIEITHENLSHHLESLRTTCGYDGESVTVTWMPNFHDWGLVEGLLQPLYNGTPCYIVAPFTFIRRPQSWLAAMSRFRGTHSQGPSFAYEHCVRRIEPDRVGDWDLSRWRAAGIAAEPISFSVMRQFADTFRRCGFRWETFCPAYGLGEATLMVAFSRIGQSPAAVELAASALEQDVAQPPIDGQPARTVVCCGTVYGDTDLKIVDPSQRAELPEGRVGEIWLRSRAVAKGYWRREADSVETFCGRLDAAPQHAFLRTGDLGFLQGCDLYVTGRLKDVIIIRGNNHYPQDIEWTIQGTHPLLAGQTGAAFSTMWEESERLIVLQEISHVPHESGQPTMMLHRIVQAIVEQHELDVFHLLLLKRGTIPKTASGKVQRRASRQAYLQKELQPLAEWHRLRTAVVESGDQHVEQHECGDARDAGISRTTQGNESTLDERGPIPRDEAPLTQRHDRFPIRESSTTPDVSAPSPRPSPPSQRTGTGERGRSDAGQMNMNDLISPPPQRTGTGERGRSDVGQMNMNDLISRPPQRTGTEERGRSDVGQMNDLISAPSQRTGTGETGQDFGIRGNREKESVTALPLSPTLSFDQGGKRAEDGWDRSLIAWLREYSERRINSLLMDQRRSMAPHVMLDFGNRGLFGLQVPRRYGGAELGYGPMLRVIEQLGAIDLSLATLVFLSNINGLRPILMFASQGMKDRLLPTLASGRNLAAFALTEPVAGSNVGAIQTTATQQCSGGWRLSGCKRWNGSAWASWVTVFAREVDLQGNKLGISAFLVPVAAAGVHVGDEALTVGLRSIVQNSLQLQNVEIPPGSLLGESGRGLDVANDALDVGRLGVVAASMGAMKRCLQLLTRYTSRRRIATGRLLDHPQVMDRVAEIACQVNALSILVQELANRLDQGDRPPAGIMMVAKVAASEYLNQTTATTVQLLGGRGYMENNEVARTWRDAKSLSIGEGTNESLLSFLGQESTVASIREWLIESGSSPRHQQLCEARDEIHAKCKSHRWLTEAQQSQWASFLIGGIMVPATIGELIRRSTLPRLTMAQAWIDCALQRATEDARRCADRIAVGSGWSELLDYVNGCTDSIGDRILATSGEDHDLDPLLQKDDSKNDPPLQAAIAEPSEACDHELDEPTAHERRLRLATLLKEQLAEKEHSGS